MFSSVCWVDEHMILKCLASVVKWLFIKVSLKHNQFSQLREMDVISEIGSSVWFWLISNELVLNANISSNQQLAYI